jgi:hypothetical protein
VKRTVNDNTSEKFLKDLGKATRSAKGKNLPRGFRYVVSENGTLFLKNLRTGEEVPVA